MRTVLLAAAAAALLLLNAGPVAAAPTKARDGYWRTSASGHLVELRVAGHRVVAVSASVETTSTGSPDAECGTQSHAFLGPFGPRGSTRRGFAIDAAAAGWSAKGTFASARKLTGTVRIHPSSRNPCTATVKFTATYDSAD